MEATRPAGSNFLQPLRVCLRKEAFNNERRHEALDMKCPAESYWPSTRHYRGLGELSYPFHDRTALYIDLEEKTLQPLDNPFGPRV